MNIAHMLETSAERHPEHPGLIEGGTTVSYGEWWRRSCAVARLLADVGVEPGDRVAVLARNSHQFLETLFGVFVVGAIVVPVNIRSHPKEVRYVLDHSGSKVLVVEDAFIDMMAAIGRSESPPVVVRIGAGDAPAGVVPYATDSEPLDPVTRESDDLAWLFYTSGTMGRPKGAKLSHGNLAFMTDSYANEVFKASLGDKALHAGPLTHGSGLWSISLAAAGVTQIIPQSRGFDPAEVLGLVELHGVTNLVFLAPTMVKMLLDSPACVRADCSSVRLLGYGGAPIHEDDQRAALDRFGAVLCNVFGQGECPMTISMLGPAQHAEAAASAPARLRSVGTPRGGLEVAVCDELGTPLPTGELGEICLRGPVVMLGYWDDEAATADAFRNDWYHTGDLGRFDEDGYLYLLDRVKEMIISGGANIYPRELEIVLIQHPAIADVAVFGIPDRHWGESVVAAVVTEPGAELTADDVVAFCRENLASYKKPRFVVFVDALPRSAYGKVLKRELAEQYAGLVADPR